MKAVLFYGVRLPSQQYVDGKVDTDYGYLFDENFVGSEWQFHTRQVRGRVSTYLCLARLNVDMKNAEPFQLINPKGLQEQKMTSSEREELRDIMETLGVSYAAPKWFLTCSE